MDNNEENVEMNEYTEKRAKNEREKQINELLDSKVADGTITEGDIEAATEFYVEYGQNKDEYLVNGAKITCDRATTEVKIVKGEPVGYKSKKRPDIRKETELKVDKNTMKIDGERVATITDRELGVNIDPFECNCMYEPTEKEAQTIIDDLEECKVFGTCKKLMKLDNDWENMIRDTKYMKFDYWKSEGGAVSEEGITMLSMLFCSKGGLITPVKSGQILHYEQKDIENDIKAGLYTEEDFNYLVATIAGEANTYKGMVAVAFEILNRCKKNGRSIEEVVTPKMQYTGFKKENVGKISDNNAIDAAVAVLRNEVENPIGNVTNHFGRVNGYDLWCEGNVCTDIIVINGNVFYEPYGAGHNQMKTKTSDAIVIYDCTKGKWLYDGVVKKSEAD